MRRKATFYPVAASLKDEKGDCRQNTTEAVGKRKDRERDE